MCEEVSGYMGISSAQPCCACKTTLKNEAYYILKHASISQL